MGPAATSNGRSRTERSIFFSAAPSRPERRRARHPRRRRRGMIQSQPFSASISLPAWIAGRPSRSASFSKSADSQKAKPSSWKDREQPPSSSSIRARPRVTRKGVELATLGPGQYFGEIALIDGGPALGNGDGGERSRLLWTDLLGVPAARRTQRHHRMEAFAVAGEAPARGKRAVPKQYPEQWSQAMEGCGDLC